MKNHLKLLSFAGLSILLINLSACDSSDRTTGNDAAAAHSDMAGNDSSQAVNRPDTTVTGVSGNTNAVNAAGNLGNGSGMGSSSLTEPAKQATTNSKSSN